MSLSIGIMQGRLSKPLNGKIQSFPKNSWKDEFYLAKDRFGMKPLFYYSEPFLYLIYLHYYHSYYIKKF